MSMKTILKSAALALAVAAGAPALAQGTPINAPAFDALVAQGPVADAATVASSTWASKIRQAGTLRLGGTQTSNLFSLLNEKDGRLRGFDAGVAQLLARYIQVPWKKNPTEYRAFAESYFNSVKPLLVSSIACMILSASGESAIPYSPNVFMCRVPPKTCS